jgi:hypothetical protein
MSLVLPKRGGAAIPSKYEPLGLRDLPFPANAVLNPYSSDERNNGTIYAESIARDAIDKFQRLLIRPDDFTNRARLAYLWSKGDRETGRGTGKTALLRYFRQRINKDWGQTEFNGQFSAVVVYVAFQQQVDRRYMEQLALSGLVDVCRSGVLDASRAALRLGQLSDEDAEKILAGEDGEQHSEHLLKDSIFEQHGLTPAKIDETIAEQLIADGVGAEAALALAKGEFEQYLRGMRKDGSLEPLYVPRDTKVLDYSRHLLFTDMVLYLRAAGFAGGYLFIDDIENLVDQMTRKHRLEFAKEFALCTVRPGYANTAYNFFSCVLTTHQQASIGLAQAWGDAGLSAIAQLDPESPNSVELAFPSKDQGRELIVAHLDHFRSNPAERGSIKPFTDDGIESLIGGDRGTVHPRRLLSRAASIVQHAVENGFTSIDAACVESAGSSAAPVVTPDFTDGIDDAL